MHAPRRSGGCKACKRLAEDARNRGPIHWELVEKFVEIKPEIKPPTDHGTHVAGIIGACKKAALERARLKAEENSPKDKAPVLPTGCARTSRSTTSVFSGPTLKETEFAIIAALQFIRYLNERDSFLTIHGANLSLSIPHDVRNFACGRTPICNECERLVDSGVVVVAAAGNHGYKSFETKDGSYESYAAFSITDPGQCRWRDHGGRDAPLLAAHLRRELLLQPRADRRRTPEARPRRARRTHPGAASRRHDGGEWGDLDGTSMAAPHVSGAAAMLMARYSELIGQPRRIKRILCESATDLGRERSFQGHGMLDVLRAFQSHLRKEDTMIFSLDVRRARKGDCLLLHYRLRRTNPGLVMIDGGPQGGLRSASQAAARADPEGARLEAERAAAGRPADGEPRRRRPHPGHSRSHQGAARSARQRRSSCRSSACGTTASTNIIGDDSEGTDGRRHRAISAARRWRAILPTT